MLSLSKARIPLYDINMRLQVINKDKYTKLIARKAAYSYVHQKKKKKTNAIID